MHSNRLRAVLQELRRSLDFFRTCGKFSIATMNRGGEKEYFLCCGCEEIYIPPTANMTLKGFMVAGTCCMNQDAHCCLAALSCMPVKATKASIPYLSCKLVLRV